MYSMYNCRSIAVMSYASVICCIFLTNVKYIFLILSYLNHMCLHDTNSRLIYTLLDLLIGQSMRRHIGNYVTTLIIRD